jgi:hypothetical protein
VSIPWRSSPADTHCEIGFRGFEGSSGEVVEAPRERKRVLKAALFVVVMKLFVEALQDL